MRFAVDDGKIDDAFQRATIPRNVVTAFDQQVSFHLKAPMDGGN
jgi:hypothetical protein